MSNPYLLLYTIYYFTLYCIRPHNTLVKDLIGKKYTGRKTVEKWHCGRDVKRKYIFILFSQLITNDEF